MAKRIWNFLAGGFVLAIVASSVLALFGASGAGGFLASWLVLGFLTARSGQPWSNTWAVAAVLTFFLPLASFFGITGQMALEASSDAEIVGGVIGSFLGSAILGFFAFFVGIIFALLAYFSRKGANQGSQRA